MTVNDYRRGFIFCHRHHRFSRADNLSGWNRIVTPGYKLFVHPDADVRQARYRSGRTVIVVGDVFVAHGGGDLDGLMGLLADGDYESLDLLSGRFAAFVIDGDDARVVHDPLGSQSTFYRLGPRSVVASHASLLAECESLERSPELVGYMATPEYRNRSTRFLPGDLTLYDEIVHLVPNNELDVRTGQTRRYWPRRPNESQDFNGLLAVWDEYFLSYKSFLDAHYYPVIGLTGGLDSRSVIATLASHGTDARYVTWDRMGEEEAARIPRLAAHLAGRHDWIRLSEKPNDPDLDSVRNSAQRATGYTRGRPLLPAQMAVGAGDADVFLKGLGGEVMRGPFNTRLKSYLPKEVDKLAYALFAGPARHDASRKFARTTTNAIRQYLERGNYSADLHGADVGDLIYWEQRMGTWTSVQHAELVTTMNSHSAMNSRKMFEAAWGLSDSERFGDQLLMRIMSKYDPVLAAL
ncbi:hypothetical protein ACFQRD_09055 [Brachybacterium sp. GCM10030268]|uniref:hypothetical protein n=1 Tax=Brachybacterium sp. GCM10030268 TaxID=3273382 RepID=UPI0036193AA9